MYVDAVRSGLVAKMEPKLWTTLCVIASFMDEKGECYPTQEAIAKGLGVKRQTANRYVKELLEFRWNDRPVIRMVKGRSGGKFDNNRYTVLPISQLTIFDNEPDTLSSVVDTETTDTANGDSK